MTSPPVDFSRLSIREAQQKLGELAHMMLVRSGVAVLVQRDDGVVTLLDSTVLKKLDPADLAEMLLGSWEEEQIVALLEKLEAS